METGTDTGKRPLMRHDGSVPSGEGLMPFIKGRYVLPQSGPTFAQGFFSLAAVLKEVEAALRREESQRWAEEEYEYDQNEEALSHDEETSR